MVIDNYDGYAAITYGGACTINVSAVFLNGDYGDNIKWSFTSLIYHEMTHIWQWYSSIVDHLKVWSVWEHLYESPVS
ncbi:hypothetical protein ACSBR1_019740 [Camellia fascicularis]